MYVCIKKKDSDTTLPSSLPYLACMCVCVYVCMHVCIYVCMYVYKHKKEGLGHHAAVLAAVFSLNVCLRVFVCMYTFIDVCIEKDLDNSLPYLA
jgi:hypothetical protein